MIFAVGTVENIVGREKMLVIYHSFHWDVVKTYQNINIPKISQNIPKK